MEKNRMKMFAKNNPWRPIYLACVLFLIIGYLLYFFAYLLPTPQWGRELMAWVMPTVKGLDSAARVGAIKGTDPFPAQVVILYCALGAFMLMGWCLFWLGYSREARQASLLQFVSQHGNSLRSRVKGFFLGVLCAFMSLFGFYAAFWFSSASTTSWQDHKFYSSSIGSASFLILAAMMFSFLAVVSAILFIYIPFSKYPILSKERN